VFCPSMKNMQSYTDLVGQEMSVDFFILTNIVTK